MGNTKYIAFAGDIYRGEEEFFSEQALLELAHGDHVGVKVLHCYLHWDGERADEKSTPYVIGHLTTHSMSGFAVVDHIAAHMKSGHIERVDVDWNDAFWLNVENRLVTDKIELIEKSDASRMALDAHQLARQIVSEARSPGPDDEKVVRVALLLRGEPVA